jgi:hypothetical protein
VITRIGTGFVVAVSASVVVMAFATTTLGQERRGDEARDRGRDVIVVAPVTKMPEAELLSTLDKVFGKQLKITPDESLKIVVLQGQEVVVEAAVQAMVELIDRGREAAKRADPPRDAPREGAPREGDRSPPPRGIDLVRLRQAKPDAVIKLVKRFLGDKVEITERPAVSALIFEGDATSVEHAASLARQLDGQYMPNSIRRVLVPAERRDRD